MAGQQHVLAESDSLRDALAAARALAALWVLTEVEYLLGERHPVFE